MKSAGLRGRSVLAGVAGLAGLAVGAAAVLVLGGRAANVDNSELEPTITSLGSRLNHQEAVVVASDFRSQGETRTSPEWSPVPAWDFQVDAVHYVAAEPVEALQTWDVAISPVPTPEGRVMATGEFLGGEWNIDLVKVAEEAGGSLILFLHAHDPAIYGDLTTPWVIGAAAVLDNERGLVFVGARDHALNEQWAGVLDRLSDPEAIVEASARAGERGFGVVDMPERFVGLLDREERDAELELDLAIAWVTAGRGNGKVGNVFSELATYPWRSEAEELQAAADEEWRQEDPSIRFIDPESTPADVLARLSEWPVLVDVALDWTGSGYLKVRTKDGVSHIAKLSGGSHPATVFAEPEDEWIILLEDSPADGVERAKVSFKPDRPSVAILIEVKGSLEQPTLSAAWVDRETVTQVMERWASQTLQESE